MPRHTFLLLDRRDFAGRLVALFLWLTAAAAVLWVANAVYREIHTPEPGNGLQYEPIWQ